MGAFVGEGRSFQALGADGTGDFDRMTRILALSLALAGAMSVSACQTPQQQNALFGGTASPAGSKTE
ncbi:MAG: hypothetical protein WBA40_08665 [Roseiarcus sp.]